MHILVVAPKLRLSKPPLTISQYGIHIAVGHCQLKVQPSHLVPVHVQLIHGKTQILITQLQSSVMLYVMLHLLAAHVIIHHQPIPDQ